MKGCMIFAVAEGISQLKWSWFLQPRSLADLGTYDSASRGPWGSLLFLFSGRLDFIATMGAIITVIALAIDPFAQQVFLFESCTLEHNDAATTIPRVQTFAPVLPGDRTMFVAGDQYARMSNVLQAAYSAMIEPSSHLPARFNHNCPSGNCTWHAPGGYYQTLMFDYACADLSNMISNTTRSASNTTSGPSYMLPSGPSLDSPTNMTIDSDTLIELRTSATLQDPPPFIPFNSTNELFAFTALYWRETVPRKGMIPPEAGPAAATCRVFPVFKTFNATVSNNILTEHEVARQAFPGWLKLPRFLRDGVWEECVSSPVATSNNTMPLSQGQFFLENWQRAALVTPGAPIDKLNITYWNPACTVMMGPVMTQQLGSYFRGLFSQRVPGGPEAIEAGTVSSLYSANASVGNDMHLSAFINGGKADMASIERYMAAMTGAMSAAMRTNANVSLAENQMTRGTTQVVKTCARVRWGWLVLPASLTVATIGFVVAIMVREGLRAKKPGWPGLLKSSPLGLMLYGPVDTSFYEYAGPKDLVTLEARAEEIKTLLERKTQ
ncbi:Hypothetical protein D9617_14g077730 [Elsinoe fawcettii]|nr:Hypothetical protein D9617_14g077730 [Elsinoe fawcettii]